jgi:hypothetical protein
MALSTNSVLLLTLDSCRYDSFAESTAPNLRSIGPLHRAMAPSYFTYGSHAAMFVGFTPGIAEAREPFVNPKYGKIFKIVGTASSAKGRERFVLHGKNIIDGFNRLGHATIGSGAVAWFDPATETGRALTQDFESYYYPGNSFSLEKQVEWILDRCAAASGRPVFAFLNVGETHVPYYHAGAPWNGAINPCLPFGTSNDAAECRRRQRACIEFCDRALAPLLHAFADAAVVACGDHGDCWGEDGLWEHGIYHPKILEVPLLFRL